MSSEYGIMGQTTLDAWYAGAKRASKALDKGDTKGALFEAQSTVESYLKYQMKTDNLKKAFGIAALVIAAVSVILGFVNRREGPGFFIVGMVVLVICGILYFKTVGKRRAVCNAFFESYEHLRNAIEDLSKNQ